MTYEVTVVLSLIILGAVFFALDWVTPDVVALCILAALTVSNVLTPQQAFSGFGSDTFVLFLGLLIMSQALIRTGVVELAGGKLLALGGANPRRLLLTTMIAVALLSAVMSNTAATAFFVPVIFGVARKADQSPSCLLMPLAFASILTSSVTLISTSTNIVVSDLLTRSHLPPMGMFELAPVGIPIAIIGLAYLWFFAPHLVPDRGGKDEMAEISRAYHTDVVILPSSPLVGKSLAQSRLGSTYDMNVRRIQRRSLLVRVTPDTVLQAGDIVTLQAPPEQIISVKDRAGIELKADVEVPPTGEEAVFAEAVILPGSPLLGQTLKGYRFGQRFNVRVIAIERGSGEPLRERLSQVRLRLGDVLLLEGQQQGLEEISESGSLRLLGVVAPPRMNFDRAIYAAAIFVVSLGLGTLKVVSLPVAALLGAIGMFVTRAISPAEAYRGVEWSALILVGAMLSLGVAMEVTGTHQLLASIVVSGLKDYGLTALLSAFFVLAVLLTQAMSNQAAAIVLVPVAMQTAVQLGANPRTFAMMIAIAASCSYLTPLEPSCLLVYGPGRYRFFDFFKVGLPLTFAIYFVAIWLVPVVWPT